MNLCKKIGAPSGSFFIPGSPLREDDVVGRDALYLDFNKR